MPCSQVGFSSLQPRPTAGCLCVCVCGGASLEGLFRIFFGYFLIDSPSAKRTRKWQQQGLLWPGGMPTITSPARASSAIVAALPPSLHRSAASPACCSAACQTKKPRDPSHNSPGQPRGAPSQRRHRCWDSAEPLVIVTELCPCFSGLPITRVVIFSLLSLVLPLAFISSSPGSPLPILLLNILFLLQFLLSSPLLRLPPGSLPFYETSHHFFLPALLLLLGFFALQLSAVPQPHKGMASTQKSLQCVTHGSYDFIFPRTPTFT